VIADDRPERGASPRSPRGRRSPGHPLAAWLGGAAGPASAQIWASGSDRLAHRGSSTLGGGQEAVVAAFSRDAHADVVLADLTDTTSVLVSSSSSTPSATAPASPSPSRVLMCGALLLDLLSIPRLTMQRS
jgi:hypothetical protein